MRPIKFYTICFILFLLSLPLFAQFQKDVIVTSPDGLWTDARAYSSLSAAITAVGANERTIVIPSPQTVTTLTVPSTVTLSFERNGAINNSGQVTINTRNIIAEDRQIFTGAGDLDFLAGSRVRSAWFATFVTAAGFLSDDTVTLTVSEQETIGANVTIGTNVFLKWETPQNRLTVSGGFTLANVGQIEAGDYQLFAGAGDIDFRDGVELNLKWFEHLRAIATWIETERATLIIPGTNTVDFTDTVPASLSMDFVKRRGQLSVSNAVTLTINGKIIAVTEQIFSGLGDVVLGSAAANPLYPEWWGALGNAIGNDAPYFNKMITSIPSTGGTVHLTANRSYAIASRLTLSKPSVNWTGYGATLLYNGAITERLMTVNAGADNNIFNGITFSGNSLQVLSGLVYLDGGTTVDESLKLENVSFVNCKFRDVVGIHSGGALNNNANNQAALTISPYGVTNFAITNSLFENISNKNDDTWKTIKSVTLTAAGSGYTTASCTITSAPAAITNGECVVTVDGAGAITSISADIGTGIYTTAAVLTVNVSGGGIGATFDIVTIPGGEELGHTAGINFVRYTSDTWDAQTVTPTNPSYGNISGNTFDNVFTELDNGLSATSGEVDVVNDADCIRMVGGTGIDSTSVNISITLSNNTFKRCGERAVKSNPGYSVGISNSLVIADQGEYYMGTIFRLNHNSIVDGLRVISAVGAKQPASIIALDEAERIGVSNVYATAADVFVVMAETGTNPIHSLSFNECHIDNLSHGITYLTIVPAAGSYDISVRNSGFRCVSDTAFGLILLTDVGGVGSTNIENVKIHNANVKLQGDNNTVNGLHITIDRAGYDGPTNLTTVSLLEVGRNGAQEYNDIRDVTINLVDIADTYTDATRPYLTYFGGDGTTLKDFKLTIGASGLNTTYPHAIFDGSDQSVDGVDYTGTGFFDLTYLQDAIPGGAVDGYHRSSFKNMSRLGGAASTLPFLTFGKGGGDVEIHSGFYLANIRDTCTGSFTPISIGDGRSILVDGLIAASTAKPLMTQGGIGSVRNDYYFPGTVTTWLDQSIDPADNATINTNFENIILNTTGDRTGLILSAPSRTGAKLTLTIGSASFDATFIGTNADFGSTGLPTFGTTAGDVQSMSFVASQGVWVATSRIIN